MDIPIGNHGSGDRAEPDPLPFFPGSGIPIEPKRETLKIRAVASLAVAVSFAYLTWRLLFTMSLASWWVSIPFFVLEAHAVLSLCLFTFSLWNVGTKPNRRIVNKTDKRLAIFIPTYNEDREILLPTIAAAVALEPAHETYVLDDGNRPEVEQLAKELGARYITRPEHINAKAGNVNHALDLVDAEFIGILDADHVPTPNFLRHTLGYFDDPKIALVQTPQEFYNLDSFEHEALDAAPTSANDEPIYHEQELFYRAIQPGKNHWDAAFWCGTGAVVRTEALRDVGGVATDTITEDIHTTIRLHRRGWKTMYHNEVLARGLAASTSEQYQLQRYRWGTGAMQVLRKENPLFVPGLRLTQRIAYASTLLAWFESWRSLGYVLLPAAVLLTGGLPMRIDPLAFAIAFGVTFFLQQTALHVLSRGYHRFILTVVFDLVRMPPNIMATLTLIWPGKQKFQVTPKGRQEDGGDRIDAPAMLVALAALNVMTAVWSVATLAGVSPITYADPWFAYGAMFWLVVNTGLIVLAIQRTHSTKYGPERRASVRFETGLEGTLDGQPCRIHEVSLTGAQVSVTAEAAQSLAGDTGDDHQFTVDVGGAELHLDAGLRWQRDRADSDRVYVGLHFAEGQTSEQARLALALLNHQVVPERPGSLAVAA